VAVPSLVEEELRHEVGGINALKQLTFWPMTT